jgi:hypothetical protein
MYALLTQCLWYPGNAKRAIQENKCTNPVIKYKTAALLTHKTAALLIQVHVFLLMFEINLFWFAARNIKLAMVAWYGA